MPRLRTVAVGVMCSLVLLSVALPGPAVAGATAADEHADVETVTVTDNVSIWERSLLPFRTEPGGPTQIKGMSLFANVPEQNTGDVPLNKPVISVYNKSEPVAMEFESTAGAGTDDFAGEDAQLVAVQLENESSMQRFTDGFDVDEIQTLLADDPDSVSIEVLDDAEGVGAIDEEGRLNASFTPKESGGYLLMLATVDSGDGFVVEDDRLRTDGDVTVVGMDCAVVQDTKSVVKPEDRRVAPGDNISFQAESNLDADEVTHAIVVYRESELVSARATATVEGPIDRSVSTEQLMVETTLDRIEGTSNVTAGTTLLSVNLSNDEFGLPTEIDGLFDLVSTAPKQGQGQGQDDVLHASMTALETEPNGTIAVETTEEFPNGNYRFVHVATAENGTQISADDGRITVTSGAGQGDGQGDGGPGDGQGDGGHGGN